MNEELKALCAPCGLDCFQCELYFSNITAEYKQKVAEMTGRDPETIPCRGCRAEHEKRLRTCAQLQCITRHEVEFCYQCQEFPCLLLAPSRDGAQLFPHNMKLFNLCRMRVVGWEQWALSEASRIRELYYKGKFIPGRGPVVNDPKQPR